MKNEFTLNFPKYFGEKTENNIFELVGNETLDIADDISHAIKTSDKIFICAENNFLDKIIDLIEESENEKLRCYILVRKIDNDKWANHHFKDRCIVREVPDLHGDYVIAGDSIFFIDESLRGLCISDKNSVEQLSKIFIAEFWMFARREFVCELSDIAEKTFDVPPVKSSETLSLHQGLEEESFLEKLLNGATVCYASSVWKRENKKLQKIYSKNFPSKGEMEFCYENNIELFYAPENNLNYIVSNDNSSYISNYDFTEGLPQKRDGRIFMLKIDAARVNGKIYKLHQQLNWEKCVGKDLLDAGNKKFVIQEECDEDKEIAFDVRTIKKNGTHNDRWDKILTEKKIFASEQKSVNINFNVTIKAVKLSFKDKAGVYKDYENANEQLRKFLDNAISQKDKELSDLDKKIKKLDADMSKTQKQVAQLEKQIDEKEKSKLVEELNGIQNIIEELTQRKNNFSDIETVDAFNTEVKSLKSVFAEFKLNLPEIKQPEFDKPRYGTLYQKGNEYEYLVSNDDFENADEEMRKTKIYDAIKFVVG